MHSSITHENRLLIGGIDGSRLQRERERVCACAAGRHRPTARSRGERDESQRDRVLERVRNCWKRNGREIRTWEVNMCEDVRVLFLYCPYSEGSGPSN